MANFKSYNKALLPETVAIIINAPKEGMLGKLVVLKRYVLQGERIYPMSQGKVVTSLDMPFDGWECWHQASLSRLFYRCESLCSIDPNFLTLSERRAYIELNRESRKGR